MSSTAHQLLRDLFRPAADGATSQALIELVLDLAVEVEALRAAVIDGGDSRVLAAYRSAYAATAMLPHDASGPAGGVHKLLERFYPDEQTEEWGEATSWREALMLRRLGASPEEIAAWQAEAREAQTFT